MICKALQINNFRIMPRKKRSSNIQQLRLNIRPSIVFFNIENQQPQHCAICLKSYLRLINPCLCHSKFHERCILNLIKKQLERQQRKSDMIEINGVKCRNCEQTYRFQHSLNRQYSCKIFLRKMNRNCCNRYVIVILILLVLLITSVTILVRFYLAPTSKTNAVYFVLITVIIVLILMVLLVGSYFMQHYALKKQLILSRIIQVTEQRSMVSQNSDDYRISDDYNIIIRD